MALGLLFSGYFITKYKPPPKYLFFWNVCIGLMSMCAALSYTQLGCGSNNFLITNGTIFSCNSNCACDGISYSPVCDRSTSTTYYSPCHAGCKTFDEKEKVYRDCACSADVSISTKRSTDDLYAIEQFTGESATNRIITDRETKPTEKRITLYEVYDEELKPNKQPHDDDTTIDGNELYEDSYEDDSVEGALSAEKIDLPMKDPNPRKRREMPEEKIISPGACLGDCTFDYYIFSLISMVSSLISSTGRIGNVLLNFR